MISPWGMLSTDKSSVLREGTIIHEPHVALMTHDLHTHDIKDTQVHLVPIQTSLTACTMSNIHQSGTQSPQAFWPVVGYLERDWEK